ncbi:hypothetical protein vseg_017852 [Gypsophila vaccaria]
MASSSPPPPPPPPPPSSPPSQPPQYWCHHCHKRVSVESLPGQPDLLCLDCHFGFVESLPPSSSPTASAAADFIDADTSTAAVDDSTLGSQFIHVLRLLSQVSRQDLPSPPPPPPLSSAAADHRDFLRIEISGVNDDGDDEEEEEEEESVRSVEIEGDSDDDDDDDVDESEEELRRRQRRDLLRLRLRDFATRARSGGRNRILDWAEILMGLETNSMELRFDTDRYVGNPGDYVNESEYEAILQNLAEADGRRGAPPASKNAVEDLKTVTVTEELVCSICKDGVSVGEAVTEMPCGHGYHGECIATWLQARNSCPVCRFELPTDDAEYEEGKGKKTPPNALVGGSSASSL